MEKNIDKIINEINLAIGNKNSQKNLANLIIGLNEKDFSLVRQRLDDDTFSMLKYILKQENKVKEKVDLYNYYAYNIKFAAIAIFFIQLVVFSFVYLEKYFEWNLTNELFELMIDRSYLQAIFLSIFFTGIYNIYDGLRFPIFLKEYLENEEEKDETKDDE